MNLNVEALRGEVAATAARLIAEGGLDYASAKQKAVRQVFGASGVPRGVMPDNEAIDEALREHLDLFDPQHGARLTRRREVAIDLMEKLAPFRPYLTGAVWKGVVAEHAPIHLQLFHDNPKDVEIELLNRGVSFEVGTMPSFRQASVDVETISFWYRREPVLLSLYAEDDLRGALRAATGDLPQRGDRAALQARSTA
jgi:hypothetical protein